MTPTPTLKRMTFGDGQCIMLLAAARMGLEPGYLADAEKQLAGGKLHPMIGAAINREACEMNERLRHDASLISQANKAVEDLMAEHGFAVARQDNPPTAANQANA